MNDATEKTKNPAGNEVRALDGGAMAPIDGAAEVSTHAPGRAVPGCMSARMGIARIGAARSGNHCKGNPCTCLPPGLYAGSFAGDLLDGSRDTEAGVR